ncbi:hypothetical protein N431DRAFT_502158 [Stipitochalara longipes BDJ]|nr:hypothetical protein N431DRAFT_502158 [Stipitochalara longipes BDJ]
MPFPSLFQKLRTRISGAKLEVEPPPYLEPLPHIQQTSVPQWLWTNAECRRWLHLVCHCTLGLNYEESSEIASRFEGCGPNIYTLKERAEGVWSLLVSMRRKKGAVPKGVNIKPHHKR